jgi:glycosyltransferase involved in cell wall biosynthesis
MNDLVDLLMVTYNRPKYTRLALPQLLATCDNRTRVWVWHNGTDRETLDIVEAQRSHPRFYRFHHAPENACLSDATNWLFQNATGDLLGKIDDDTLVPAGWYEPLRRAHHDFRRFGALADWVFYHPQDFQPALAQHKVRSFPGGHKILQHPWVGGCAFLMKRKCLVTNGLLKAGESFPAYSLRLAWSGWINGLYHPPIFVEHMDDPRSPHTLLRTDADLRRYAPLTAAKNMITTLPAWQQTIHDIALKVQAGRVDPCRLYWLRGWPHRLAAGVRGLRAAARSRRTDFSPGSAVAQN